MSDELELLSEVGVSVWLDDLSRERLRSGSLERLVRNLHVVGVTTNPAIFQKAVGSGEHYAEQLARLAGSGADAEQALWALTAADVRDAADVLLPAYRASGGRDGRVSLEVDPRLAHRTEESVAEAVRLWRLVDRPNLLIKIPATPEGLPAISAVLALGISVNVTLIFSLERYRAVIDAYLTGLERARENGHELSGIESVASFFVSRVDTEIDRRLMKIGTEEALALKGAAAVANARLAYQAHEEVFGSHDGLIEPSGRWAALAAAGAHPQRPLWASTGVKDPDYPDDKYVVELAGPGTVNTMPEATLLAMADHGVVRGDTVTCGYAGATVVLERISALGISYDEVVRQLEDEGVAKFEAAWARLLETVGSALHRRAGASGQAPPPA